MFGRGGANVNRRSDRRASLFSEAASPNTWKKNETFYTVSSEQPPMGSITQAGPLHPLPPTLPPPFKKMTCWHRAQYLGFMWQSSTPTIQSTMILSWGDMFLSTRTILGVLSCFFEGKKVMSWQFNRPLVCLSLLAVHSTILSSKNILCRWQ